MIPLTAHRVSAPLSGSVVKFSTDAFSKPLLYLNSEEDSDTVQRYKHHMEGNDGEELQEDFKVSNQYTRLAWCKMPFARENDIGLGGLMTDWLRKYTLTHGSWVRASVCSVVGT